MTYINTLRASVCAAAIAAGSSASADVTAVQVWDNWKEMISAFGDDGISIGSEEITSDSVIVNDISIMMDDDNASVSADFGDVTFQEQGDGTVLVTLASAYPMKITGEDGTVVDMTLSHNGLKIVVSGDPSSFDYAFSADQYNVSVDSIKTEEGAVQGDVRFTANSIAGSYTFDMGETQNIDYDVTMASMDMFVDVKDPAESINMLMSGKINDLGMRAQMALPLDMESDNPFEDGLAFTGGYTFGGANYIFEIQEDGANVNGTASTESGVLAMNMDQSNMAYDALVSGLDINANVADLPFPIMVSLAEYGIKFGMPLAKTEEPADFSLGINLTELAVNDEIWMMGDPSGQLAHDPVTARLDITGKAKLFESILNDEPTAFGQAPGEIYSLNLNDLTLDAAGALIKGVGSFTFDNNDLATFGGIPRPEGEINIDIKGANQLIDSLVSMGLLPEDQAMMGRMMMGMFARTTGDDELSSKIEVNSQGHILANGQRIQ